MPSNVDTSELKSFLLAANEAGYAGGDEKTWVRQADGSLMIAYERGPWRVDDNFFGGEPYGGREVVFHDGRPVWMLVYYGWVAPELDPDEVYGVLRRALREMPAEHPYRGPEHYPERSYAYVNSWQGDVSRLRGTEEIRRDGALIYSASYAGGWVDARRGV